MVVMRALAIRRFGNGMAKNRPALPTSASANELLAILEEPISTFPRSGPPHRAPVVLNDLALAMQEEAAGKLAEQCKEFKFRLGRFACRSNPNPLGHGMIAGLALGTALDGAISTIEPRIAVLASVIIVAGICFGHFVDAIRYHIERERVSRAIPVMLKVKEGAKNLLAGDTIKSPEARKALEEIAK